MNTPVIEQLNLLLKQALYAPHNQRLAQLDNCEKLIKIIQPGQNYNFEFICYHLTGYRPSKAPTTNQDMIDFEELVNQINEYSRQLSGAMQIKLETLGRKFYTSKALADRFHVAEKTITRWRIRGLIGRYITFPDGKRRFAFSADIVEHFVKLNRQKVNQATGFHKINNVTRESIVTRLSQLAQAEPGKRWQAIKQVANEFNRSIESVRLILTSATKQGQLKTDFDTGTEPLPTELRQQIYHLYEKGVSVADLCQQFNRSRSNIYHAIRLSQTEELMGRDLRFIATTEFDNPEFIEQLLAEKPELNPSMKAKLEDEQEYWLFARYNYFKYKASEARKNISLNNPSAADIAQAFQYLQQAIKIRDLLASINMPLVISVANKHSYINSELQDYISEGNMILLNAIEKFDFSKGNKFSTYATWALVKRFATLKTKLARDYQVHNQEIIDVQNDYRLPPSQVLAREAARKSLQKAIAQNLLHREQIIIQEHFGLLDNEDKQQKPLSLAQIAEKLGISKERVRQIEIFALQKLRGKLSPEQFELLTDK